MGNLGDILKQRIKAIGAERQVEAAGIVEAATKEIAKYIPREDFKVISFNRGVLKVGVSSSSVSSEINFNKEKIKKEIESVQNIKTIINTVLE